MDGVMDVDIEFWSLPLGHHAATGHTKRKTKPHDPCLSFEKDGVDSSQTSVHSSFSRDIFSFFLKGIKCFVLCCFFFF